MIVRISASMHGTERPSRKCVFTAPDVKFLGGVVFIVLTLPKLCSLITEPHTSKLATETDERSKQGI